MNEGVKATMLMIAEGTVNGEFADADVRAIEAWLGPTVDSGFLQHGYVDVTKMRVWLILSDSDIVSAEQRLKNFSVLGNASLVFSILPVTGLRFR